MILTFHALGTYNIDCRHWQIVIAFYNYQTIDYVLMFIF